MTLKVNTLFRNRDALNFDHYFRQREARNRNRRAGWKNLVKYLAAQFRHAGCKASINQKHCHRNDVLQ